MARPKETISTLPEGWQGSIINLYREGGSDVEVKAMIYEWRDSFSNNLWDRWLKEEGEFWETIKRGRMLSEAWWMKQGRESLRDKEFSATLFYMNMKNRFGWKDRHEVDESGDKTVRFIFEDGANNKNTEK